MNVGFNPQCNTAQQNYAAGNKNRQKLGFGANIYCEETAAKVLNASIASILTKKGENLKTVEKIIKSYPKVLDYDFERLTQHMPHEKVFLAGGISDGKDTLALYNSYGEKISHIVAPTEEILLPNIRTTSPARILLNKLFPTGHPLTKIVDNLTHEETMGMDYKPKRHFSFLSFKF